MLFMLNYFFFMLFLIIILLLVNWKNLLMILICLELFSFFLLFLFMILINFKTYLMIYYIIFAVCEGAMGLCILSMSIRFSNDDYISLYNLVLL